MSTATTAIDPFFLNGSLQPWYQERPLVVAFVVSVLLHALALLFLPGLRPQLPEEKTLTVELAPAQLEPAPDAGTASRETRKPAPKPVAPQRPQLVQRATPTPQPQQRRPEPQPQPVPIQATPQITAPPTQPVEPVARVERPELRQEPRVQPQARPAPRPEQPPVQRSEPRIEPRRECPLPRPSPGRRLRLP